MGMSSGQHSLCYLYLHIRCGDLLVLLGLCFLCSLAACIWNITSMSITILMWLCSVQQVWELLYLHFTEWFGLEETLKTISFQPLPWARNLPLGQEISFQKLKSLVSLALETKHIPSCWHKAKEQPWILLELPLRLLCPDLLQEAEMLPHMEPNTVQKPPGKERDALKPPLQRLKEVCSIYFFFRQRVSSVRKILWVFFQVTSHYARSRSSSRQEQN